MAMPGYGFSGCCGYCWKVVVLYQDHNCLTRYYGYGCDYGYCCSCIYGWAMMAMAVTMATAAAVSMGYDGYGCDYGYGCSCIYGL
jgi:hypothetical protein